MDEAEQICDRLLVMDQGKIIAEGSPQHLVQQYAGQEILEIIPEQMDAAGLLEALKSCPGYQQVGDRYEVFSSDCPGLLDTIRSKVNLKGFGLRKATLEDVFIRLTGRELRD
jgi:lipooligosaccharide transport system ATP-binding protein